LSHVRKNNTRDFIILAGNFLRLDSFDEVDSRAFINPSPASNNTMSKDSKILAVFVEEDDNTLLCGKIRGDENGKIRFIGSGAEREKYLLKAERFEAIRDDFADSTCRIIRWK
jgi:hypothetical protein